MLTGPWRSGISRWADEDLVIMRCVLWEAKEERLGFTLSRQTLFVHGHAVLQRRDGERERKHVEEPMARGEGERAAEARDLKVTGKVKVKAKAHA